MSEDRQLVLEALVVFHKATAGHENWQRAIARCEEARLAFRRGAMDWETVRRRFADMESASAQAVKAHELAQEAYWRARAA